MNCLRCRTEISNLKDAWHGLHANCFKQTFGLKQLEGFKDVQRRSISQNSAEPGRLQAPASWNTSFFHGKFKKYSATLAGTSYILKVKQEDAPQLPDVEYVCNEMAKHCGLNVPAFALINCQDFKGARTFVTKNFIEKRERSKNLTHIYTYISESGRYDVETLVGIIDRETKRFVDLDQFVRMCLFDSLIGNHDRHGRNIGFIVTSSGSTLAPIYDNTSALGLEDDDFLGADFNPGGAILTEGTTAEYPPSVSDYVQEFYRLEFKDSVHEFVEKFDLNRLIKMIKAGTYSKKMAEALTKLLGKRYKDLMDAR